MEVKIRDLRRKGYFTPDNEIVDEMLKIIGTSAFAIYCIICRHADTNQKSFPSQGTIAEKMNCHRDTVIDKIKILEQYKMIKVDQTKEEGTGKWLHNTYTLLDKTVWIKHLYGNRVDKTSIRSEANTVSTNSDTNNTHGFKKTNKNLNNSEYGELKSSGDLRRGRSLTGKKSYGNQPKFSKPIKIGTHLEHIK